MLASLLNPVDKEEADEDSSDGKKSGEKYNENSKETQKSDESTETEAKNKTKAKLKSKVRSGRKRKHGKRSRSGCLTCRRRKKKCTEEHPVCHHCHRLDLTCVWKKPPGPALPPLASLPLPSFPLSPVSSPSVWPATSSPTESLQVPTILSKPTLSNVSTPTNIPHPTTRYTTVEQHREPPEETYVEGIGYVKVLRGKVEAKKPEK